MIPELYEKLHGRNPHAIRLRCEVIETTGRLLVTAYVTSRATVPQDIQLGKVTVPGAEWVGIENGTMAIRYRCNLPAMRGPKEIVTALAACNPARALEACK